MTRFGIRFGGGWLPNAEVTVRTLVAPGEYHHTVVKRKYGWNRSRALIRAQNWTRANGDPR